VVRAASIGAVHGLRPWTGKQTLALRVVEGRDLRSLKSTRRPRREETEVRVLLVGSESTFVDPARLAHRRGFDRLLPVWGFYVAGGRG
jgi:hypothetical protein